jgi:hypothetical protein
MATAGQAVIDDGWKDDSGIVPFFEKHKRKAYQFAYQLTVSFRQACGACRFR